MRRGLFMTAMVAGLGGAAVVAAPPPVRLAYNYCTLSYTFAYYSDAEWEAEIDRLAKAGYNAALVTDGTFKVWQLTLRELGYAEEDIAAFLPDECARAWWLMGNLTGEGGPLDAAAIEADGSRGRFICERMRAHGIEPVLQGFVGFMPLTRQDKQDSEELTGLGGADVFIAETQRSQRLKPLCDSASLRLCDKKDEGSPSHSSFFILHSSLIPQGKWACYERPPLLDPTSEAFGKVAEVWYRNLEKVYGFQPKYLAGDLFHEGGQTGGLDVTDATRRVQAAQQRAFPGVTWVVQAWQANPTAAVRAGLDPRHTLIEALVKDMGHDPQPLDFGDLPWIWCEVLNFGGNHGLYGNLRTFAHLGLCTNATFRGYGALSEGFFTNPVCSDLFEDMMMRPVGSVMTDAELSAWLDDWVDRRYGLKDARIREAWRILARTVYACPWEQEGTVENVMCAEPSWTANNVSTWGPRRGLWYDPTELEQAFGLMEEVRSDVNLLSSSSDHLKRDIEDVFRQVSANRARALVPRLRDDPCAREHFLSELEVLADFLSSSRAFSLEARLARARTRAGERGERAFRRMVTTWADPSHGRTTLADYAHREYAELLRGYYLPRWKAFLSSPPPRAR